MSIIYFPILKALAAELAALEQMKQWNANQMIPLFEIPKITDQIREKKKYRKCPSIKTDYLDDTSEKIGGIWEGRRAMFDMYHWYPTETVESGEHVIPYTYSALKNMGVDTVPVVGYDRWNNLEYQLALISISKTHPGGFCIRLDQTAFEDAAEPEYFQDNIQDILTTLEISSANCRVIFDFEDVTSLSIADMLSKFELLLGLISSYGFLGLSIAACSLAKTINGAVKEPNTCGRVLRKEMLLWKNARKQFPQLPINFGDYGVRGPHTNEGIRSPNTNGKIRYTIENEYFIARGHSISKPPRGEQMWELAQKIIDSGHYLGPDFSWGDNEILRCSHMEFKGNAGNWITIDTNHHFTFVVAEIAEFERTLMSIPVTV